MFVVDRSKGMGLIRMTAQFADVTSHPDGIIGFSGGLDKDVSALANSKSDDFSPVGLDGNKIVCNNRHGMDIDAELLKAFSSSIDKAQSVSLPGVELELRQPGIGHTVGSAIIQGTVVIHLPIDKIVVRVGNVDAAYVSLHERVVFRMKVVSLREVSIIPHILLAVCCSRGGRDPSQCHMKHAQVHR